VLFRSRSKSSVPTENMLSKSDAIDMLVVDSSVGAKSNVLAPATPEPTNANTHTTVNTHATAAVSEEGAGKHMSAKETETELNILEETRSGLAEFEDWNMIRLTSAIMRNTIQNNLMDGVRVAGTGRVLIRHNTISLNKNCGVVIAGQSGRADIQSNKINQCHRYGVLVNNGSCVVRGNRIQLCTMGGVCARGGNVLLEWNDVAGDTSPVQLQSGSRAVIRGNVLHGSECHGIEILRESSCTILNNVIFGHKWCGVYVGLTANHVTHASNWIAECSHAPVWDTRIVAATDPNVQ